MNEIEVLRKEGFGIKKICQTLKLGTRKVMNELKLLGLNTTSNAINSGRKRKYSINHNFFTTIDSEEKAYILGFIYADGSVSDVNNTLNITLKASEKLFLEAINHMMGSDYKLHMNKGRYNSLCPVTEKVVLSICSKQIVNDLISLGCTPRKSDTLQFPFIREDLMCHFMRGYFDGDGTVFLHLKKYIRFGIIGTYEFCKSYIDVLKLDVTIYKEKRTDKNVWYINIGNKKTVFKIYNFLYKEHSICLKRKYDVFNNHFNKEPSTTIMEIPEMVMV
jgi:hypothetical protein